MGIDDHRKSTDVVTTVYEGDIAIITMDDGKANAMNAPFLEALEAAFDGVDASEAEAVALFGRPQLFGPGVDLRGWPELDADGKTDLLRRLSRTLLRVFTFPRPVVAGIGGHALAGGAILALAADTRIAARGSYQLGVNEVAVGVTLPSFAVTIAQHAIPQDQRAEMLLHGRIVSPDEAASRRLVTETAEPEALASAVRERAEELAKVPRRAYRATKERLRGEAAQRARDELDRELDEFIVDLDRAAQA